MPDTGASRKRQIARRPIPGDLAALRARTPGFSTEPLRRRPPARLTATLAEAASITRACYLCNIGPKTAL
jgi:hypothetical protein